ncbi:hypothetical protein WJX81_003949 [Elliptochloris bilobata]|uniref:Uncharacterized protein n=1 Tax=Elliptochloris bilobata TaxID=381761 RepID=A0AAW1QY23_9CHLO
MSPTPYSVQLDADTARRYVETGATMLLLDVPEHTVVGIDQQSFVVGPKFCGVKMLPPGPHMISYNAASSGGAELAPTTSFFVHAPARSVLVRRWDARAELLAELEKEEAERYTAGVRRFDFDFGLAPYNLASYAQWRALSEYLTPAVLERLSPVQGAHFSITAEADPTLTAPRSAAEARLAAQLAGGAPPGAASGGECVAGNELGVGRCRHTRLPRLVKAPGMTAAELTAANLDRSAALEEVLAQAYGGDEAGLLGELQFAFLAFLMGHSLEGYAQWKALLALALSCEAAPLGSRSQLYRRLLSALACQLALCLGLQSGSGLGSSGAGPLGLPIAEELLADSFLRRLFARFFEAVREGGPRGAPVQAEVDALRRLLAERLGWDFDASELGDEDNEDAPVVVEL